MTDATAHRPDSFDRPDIIVFPPIIPLSTLVISCVLQWLAPLGLVADIDQAWRIGWGAILFTGGMLTTIVARHSTGCCCSSFRAGSCCTSPS
jgi:hypothetical protein